MKRASSSCQPLNQACGRIAGSFAFASLFRQAQDERDQLHLPRSQSPSKGERTVAPA